MEVIPKEWQQRAEAVIEKIENDAFLDGYLYAIKVLQDGVGNKEY